jgi:hypothetical protein
MNFLEDCEILHTHGDHHLCLYTGNRLAIVNKEGTGIGTLGSFVETDESGRVHDACDLIDFVARGFVKMRNEKGGGDE